MAACDLLSLPSWNEGTPNVLLEAGASGRRVVATAVGGISELMTRPIQGEMVEPRDVLGLAGALERVLYSAYDPVAVAAASRRWSWHDSARQLHGILARAIDAHQAVPGRAFGQERGRSGPNSPGHRPVLAAR
jgi:glycosyltransferase involved in cell wall biosynthesis